MTRIPTARSPPLRLLLLLLSWAVFARAQQQQQPRPFLTEIFPEQFEQQQLQFRMNQVQVQLQQVQQALEARPQDPSLVESLLFQQDQFRRFAQDIQQQQLVLQQRIQDRLNGAQQSPVVQPVQVPLFARPPPEQQQPQPPVADVRKPAADGACKTVAGESGTCRPLVNCLSFYAELPELKKQPCRLAANEFGVCCPTRNADTGTLSVLVQSLVKYFLPK